MSLHPELDQDLDLHLDLLKTSGIDVLQGFQRNGMAENSGRLLRIRAILA
jgi:hypothetical protein